MNNMKFKFKIKIILITKMLKYSQIAKRKQVAIINKIWNKTKEIIILPYRIKTK